MPLVCIPLMFQVSVAAVLWMLTTFSHCTVSSENELRAFCEVWFLSLRDSTWSETNTYMYQSWQQSRNHSHKKHIGKLWQLWKTLNVGTFDLSKMVPTGIAYSLLHFIEILTRCMLTIRVGIMQCLKLVIFQSVCQSWNLGYASF